MYSNQDWWKKMDQHLFSSGNEVETDGDDCDRDDYDDYMDGDEKKKEEIIEKKSKKKKKWKLN